MYFRFDPSLGVLMFSWSSYVIFAKDTVFLGVPNLDGALPFRPLRVISRNCLPDLPVEAPPPLVLEDVRGVKKRVKRLGVIGGGFLGFLLPVLDEGASGDDANGSDGA